MALSQKEVGGRRQECDSQQTAEHLEDTKAGCEIEPNQIGPDGDCDQNEPQERETDLDLGGPGQLGHHEVILTR
jgi:hypothetical protein